jgi:hypothetical protein
MATTVIVVVDVVATANAISIAGAAVIATFVGSLII